MTVEVEVEVLPQTSDTRPQTIGERRFQVGWHFGFGRGTDVLAV